MDWQLLSEVLGQPFSPVLLRLFDPWRWDQ